MNKSSEMMFTVAATIAVYCGCCFGKVEYYVWQILFIFAPHNNNNHEKNGRIWSILYIWATLTIGFVYTLHTCIRLNDVDVNIVSCNTI